MPKVILICGKICSGKSTYAEKLRIEEKAVVLSCDEITLALFGQHAGENHDLYVERTQNYLFGKSLEIVETGINVVLDWGFWTKEERDFAKRFYRERGIACELHYIDINDSTWKTNLSKRNKAINEGKTIAYIIDELIAKKFAALFETPSDSEIDIRYANNWASTCFCGHDCSRCVTYRATVNNDDNPNDKDGGKAMIRGILIFGANGSGKSMLGRALATRVGYRHIDAEDYYFPPQDIPYTVSRQKDEVIRLMLDDIEKYGNFVLTSVTGDYGEKIVARYDLAICLTVPREVRLDRIRNRALEKYGERVLLGGDMYENNKQFIEFTKNRPLEVVDEFAKKLTCPVVYIDGTQPVEVSIDKIKAIINNGVVYE